MQSNWRWRGGVLLVLTLGVSVSQTVTAGGPYRKQHQPAIYVGGAANNGRWHQHYHRSGMVPVSRVHRSGGPAHYQLPALPGNRYRGPPVGPVKRVYLPYKYLPPQLQQKFRYSVNGAVHAKRQVMNVPPPGWKPKRNLHLGASMHAFNSYMPARKSKHPAKYIPNAGKLSQNSVGASSVVTDSYGAPYKLTSTTYGVPHPTQGAPEPPTSNADLPSSFVQVYHGNNRELEAQTSYAFNTQHHLTSGGSPHKTHQIVASHQQAQTRPAKTKTSHGSASSSVNYHLELGINEHPVYRPLTSNSTHSKGHHKISSKEAQPTNNYGSFQPPKQTYGFQPYDEKESTVIGTGTSVSEPYYSSSSQTASTASLTPSATSATSSTSSQHTRQEYLSPSYFQQKS